MAAAPSEYSLRVYRGGSHSSGQDVVTDATGSTILCARLLPATPADARSYGISAEFANPQALTTTLRLRKGTDGPILCTADAPPSQPMIVNFPTGWSTTLAKEGLLTKQAVFSGFGGEKYGWRRGGTAFVAMATEVRPPRLWRDADDAVRGSEDAKGRGTVSERRVQPWRRPRRIHALGCARCANRPVRRDGAGDRGRGAGGQGPVKRTIATASPCRAC